MFVAAIDGARGRGVGLAQHLAHRGVADDDRHAQPPGRRHEAAVGVHLDDHDALAVGQQLLDDAVADVAQPADDDVAAVGNAPHLQGAAEAGAQQVVGHDGGERRRQGRARDAQHADEDLQPAAMS